MEIVVVHVMLALIMVTDAIRAGIVYINRSMSILDTKQLYHDKTKNYHLPPTLVCYSLTKT